MGDELRKLVEQALAGAFDDGYARGYSAGLDEAGRQNDAVETKRAMKRASVDNLLENIERHLPTEVGDD